MDINFYENMQSAVGIVGQSEHPTSKVAATIAGKNAAGDDFSLSRINRRPDALREKIGMETKIGGASGFIHAETVCLLDAPCTDGSSMFVTDPPCPNCVKNMAEAGVSALYIDHKGFDKDFATRRGADFWDMSMHICEKAGIHVYKIFRKEQRLETILNIRDDYIPPLEKPARVRELPGGIDKEKFRALVKTEETFYEGRPFAVAVASPAYLISAEIHAITGFTAKTAPQGEGKYTFLLQPVHRVMMTAARDGLRIDKDFLFSSRIPTAREQVNMIGAGLTGIYIGSAGDARDEDAMAALKMLTDAEILKIISL